jgi:hypothetical protein
MTDPRDVGFFSDAETARHPYGYLDELIHARRYEYLPSYMFRGLTALHLEFTPKD